VPTPPRQVKELRARAKAQGASAEQLEAAADSEDQKTVLVGLLLELGGAAAARPGGLSAGQGSGDSAAEVGFGRIVACTLAHPLHTRSMKRFGISTFETTMRPNPRRGGPPRACSNRSGTVRARPGRLSGLSVCHSGSVFYGAFVRACRSLNRPERWFSARAVGRSSAADALWARMNSQKKSGFTL
jgi:hypothetical protein